MALALSGCTSTHITVVNFNPRPPVSVVNLAPRPAQLVGHQLRIIRVAEENAAIASTGHPQPLPTGICRAVIALTPAGTVAGSPLIQCENTALYQRP
jgi:hypothetical protein